MGGQLDNLRGQMRKLLTIVDDNNKEIKTNLIIAKKRKNKTMKMRCCLPVERPPDSRNQMKNIRHYTPKCLYCIEFYLKCIQILKF